jgi:hypothetical protein
VLDQLLANLGYKQVGCNNSAGAFECNGIASNVDPSSDPAI